jgi:uncharacterized membrane protein
MYETKRPDINPKRSTFEKVLQIFCILILIASFIIVIISWSALPKSIPSHFNAAGVPDAWGRKSTLFTLPIIGFVMYLLLTPLEHFTKIFNFSFEITEKNARFVYQIAREMLVCLKLEMLLVFGYIQWNEVEVAKGGHMGLGTWFITVTILIIAATMVYYIWRIMKHKKGE